MISLPFFKTVSQAFISWLHQLLLIESSLYCTIYFTVVRQVSYRVKILAKNTHLVYDIIHTTEKLNISVFLLLIEFQRHFIPFHVNIFSKFW